MMFRTRGRAAPRMPAGQAASGWRWLAGLAAAPVVVVSVFRAVPREWPTTAVQLVSFTPWLVLPAGASLLFAVLGRRRWMAGAAAGLVAVQLFWLVREHGITLLTIQEYTQALEDRLAAAGLATLLPNRISDPAGHTAGNAVYSVHELVAAGEVPDSHFPMPVIRLTAEAHGQRAVVEVTNVHARAPVGVGLPKWRSDLVALGGLVSRPGNVVLAGDFNASYDHAEFRELLQGEPRRCAARTMPCTAWPGRTTPPSRPR